MRDGAGANFGAFADEHDAELAAGIEQLAHHDAVAFLENAQRQAHPREEDRAQREKRQFQR
jgi:hypothetical protein